MTREEVCNAAEVMLAYADGKNIQYFDDNVGKWVDFYATEPLFNWNIKNFRVKPEPKYRPYNSAEEFMKAQKEHGLYFMRDERYYLPSYIDNNGITAVDNKYCRCFYRELLADYKWQDGSPMGIPE